MALYFEMRRPAGYHVLKQIEWKKTLTNPDTLLRDRICFINGETDLLSRQ